MIRLVFFVFLDYAIHFPEKGENVVIINSETPSLTQVTICVWMSSSHSKGTPFSYAVRNGIELLIDYDENFQLTIAGEVRWCKYHKLQVRS